VIGHLGGKLAGALIERAPVLKTDLGAVAKTALRAGAEVIEEGASAMKGAVRRALNTAAEAIDAHAAQADVNLARAILDGRQGEIGAAGRIPSREEAKRIVDATNAAAQNAEPLKIGDVMGYREYRARRPVGSTLRGHHAPQAARLEEMGIDPREGTVVVLENEVTGPAGEKLGHTGTRTHGTAGAKVAASEKGKPLSFSETKDLLDPPVERLGPEVGEKIQARNRELFKDKF
jgi:hypothetical protein